MKGKLYKHNIILGGNIEKPPFTLAMFVDGNGAYDELQLQVNSLDEVRQLIILNKENKIIFNLPVHESSAISERAEPGVLVVIKQGKCTRKIYDKNNPTFKPTEENVSGDECEKIKEKVNTETKEYEIDGILRDNQAVKDLKGKYSGLVQSSMSLKNIAIWDKINFS